MAITTKSDTIVIIDDEPYNVTWMIDYLESKDIKVITCVDANQSIRVIREEIYRALVIDLSIPIFEPFRSSLAQVGEIYQRYPGLLLAREARNVGYRGKQVIVYSVHKDEAIQAEVNRLM